MSGTVADKLKATAAAIAHLKRVHWEIACEHDKYRDKWKELCDATGCVGHATALEWIKQAISEIDRLMRNWTIATDVQGKLKAKLQAVEEDRAAIAKERDEAREFCRRFRSVDTIGDWDIVADAYDAKFGHSAPPLQDDADELVPWTAATRPRGPMTLRKRGSDDLEFQPTWCSWGTCAYTVDLSWETLQHEYEYTRDGVNWQPCGTRKAVQK